MKNTRESIMLALILVLSCITVALSLKILKNQDTIKNENGKSSDKEVSVEKTNSYSDIILPDTNHKIEELFIEGGERNYEADCDWVRQSHWDGYYNGQLILTKDNHLVSYDPDGKIWIDNYSFGWRSIHYNPEKDYDEDYDVDCIYDGEYAWFKRSNLYTGEYYLEKWDDGYPEKTIKNDDMILKKEDRNIANMAYTEFNLINEDYMFESCGEKAVLINLETGKVTKIANDIIDVLFEKNSSEYDSVKYIRKNHIAYELSEDNPKEPKIIQTNIVHFQRPQVTKTIRSAEELRVFKKVKNALNDGYYEGEFIELSQLTKLNSDANIFVSISNVDELIINNKETGMYINSYNPKYKYEGGNANYYEDLGHDYLFYDNKVKMYMNTKSVKKEFSIPKGKGYNIHTVDEIYNQLIIADIPSYRIILEVYGENASEAYLINISADGNGVSIKKIAKDIKDMQIGICYNSVDDFTHMITDFNDYTTDMFYVDSNNTAYEIEGVTSTLLSEKIKITDDAYGLCHDYVGKIIVEKAKANNKEQGYKHLYVNTTIAQNN